MVVEACSNLQWDTVELPKPLGTVFSQKEALTKYFYKEIFQDEGYKPKNEVSEGGVIIDAGCNIGLFSIWAALRWPKARIISFEPVTPTWNCASQNLRSKGIKNVKLVRSGLSDAVAKDVEFTYYPNRPGVSTMRPMTGAQEAQWLAGLAKLAEARDTKGCDEAFFRSHLEKKEIIRADLVRLHDIIAAEGIDRIDLLKIDVERCELQVLQGLDPEDFAKIREIIIEVEDKMTQLPVITELLKNYGFEIEAHHECTNDGAENPWFASLHAFKKE